MLNRRFRIMVLSAVVLSLILTACADPELGADTSAPDPEPTTTLRETTTTTVAPGFQVACGAVHLSGGLDPVLPSTPIDSEGEAALETMRKVAASEATFFDQYEWFTAERSDDLLVLFGAPVGETPEGAPPYAYATFQPDGDTWRPGGWGQCRVEASSPDYGIAHWVLDPDHDPASTGTELHVLIHERSCANGEPPIGREIVPVVLEDPDAIRITVLVEPVSGAATCPGNPWYPVTIALSDPVGDRKLFDSSVVPQLERFWPPSQEVLGSFGSEG